MGLLEFEGDAKIFSKSQSPLRWLILFLACVMMIGNYYCYDNPAALKTQIQAQMGDPADYETMYSLLYTVYSLPNIILPFFGGYFVDLMGVRLCLLVFAGLILLGQVVFAIGLSAKSWPIMFVGRVIYGFGGESLSVGNSALLAQWFAGKELAFAFGLNLSIARLGSVINNLVSPQMSNMSGVVFALWFGALVCGISFFCTSLIIPIDKGLDIVLEKSEKMREPLLTDVVENSDAKQEEILDRDDSFTGLNSTKGGKSSDVLSDNGSEDGNAADVDIWAVKDFEIPFFVLTLSCVVVYGCVLPFNNVASSLLLERDYFMEQPNAGCVLTPNAGDCQTDTNVPSAECNMGQWYQPPLPTDADVDCDNDPDGCYKVYCDGLSNGEIQATTVMSIPYIISACLSPILGGFVDKFGMRAVIATLAPLALTIVHALLGYSRVSPIGPLVGQGLAYSGFAAVIWPSLPLVVEPKYIGLGYGFVTAIQNIGLACFPLIIAQIYMDSNQQYIPNVELFFMFLAIGGVIVGLYLNYYDVHHNNIFNGTSPPIDVDEEEEDEDSKEGRDRAATLRAISADKGGSRSRSYRASRDGSGHAPTFSLHEEVHRARMASGDVKPLSRSNSRAGSRSNRSNDINKLQGQYAAVPSETGRASMGSRNSRHSSSEILATSGIH